MSVCRARSLSLFGIDALPVEAAAIGGVEVYGMRTLREAVEFLGDSARVCPAEPAVEDGRLVEAGEDFADVAGQRYAKRALEVAAAGAHNVVT